MKKLLMIALLGIMTSGLAGCKMMHPCGCGGAKCKKAEKEACVRKCEKSEKDASCMKCKKAGKGVSCEKCEKTEKMEEKKDK